MEKCFLELQKAIELIKKKKKKNSINFMYFHQTELFTDYSQETHIMQTGVCCRGTVKYWLGLPYIYARICYYVSRNKSG